MHIPARRRRLLRNFEQALFYSKHNKTEQRYAFYLLLRPELTFSEKPMAEFLEPLEIENELYILCMNVYSEFDREKSSIVPYLSRVLPWHFSRLFKRLKKEYKNLRDLIADQEEESYLLDEEFYWQNILYQDTFVGKCFTRSEKYIIHRILNSDEEDLTIMKLANQLGRKRWQMKERLLELKEVFEMENINVKE